MGGKIVNPLDASLCTQMNLRYTIMEFHSGVGIGAPVNCAISLKKDPMLNDPEIGVAS